MKTHGASLATRPPAITLDVDLIHDIDLFVFEGAWVTLGVALLRAEHRPRPEIASTLV
jgi:hypothetical protein